MSKSIDAFRTIGEVADELDVPKHVLRFWEGKFPHIRPMKRGGGRRYYRPEDMELLRGIRHLLHAEGYTIKGVQKILREQGIDQVKTAAVAASVTKVTAEKTSTKARARVPRPAAVRTAIPAAAAKPVALSGAETKMAASAADAEPPRQSVANDPKYITKTTKDVIAAAIRELEVCRQLLTAAAGKPLTRDTPPLRAARS